MFPEELAAVRVGLRPLGTPTCINPLGAVGLNSINAVSGAAPVVLGPFYEAGDYKLCVSMVCLSA